MLDETGERGGLFLVEIDLLGDPGLDTEIPLSLPGRTSFRLDVLIFGELDDDEEADDGLGKDNLGFLVGVLEGVLGLLGTLRGQRNKRGNCSGRAEGGQADKTIEFPLKYKFIHRQI